MRKYPDCMRADRLYEACSVSSRGLDCHSNKTNKLLYQRSLAETIQQQVADTAKMNVRQIQKLESGEGDFGSMTLRSALALAEALDCDIDDFL